MPAAPYGTVRGMMLAATAPPAIVAERRGFAHLSWVVTAYLLTSTITETRGSVSGKPASNVRR